MPKVTGSCLCGQVSFEADGDIVVAGNCHCDQCRKSTGAVFATNVFMKSEDIKFSGESSSHTHEADSGNKLTKHFCPNCGSQVYGSNTGRPGMNVLRAGAINEKDLIKPMFNVFCSSAVPTTPRDENLKAFDKMPG